MAKADVQVYLDQAPRPGSLNGLRIREDVAFTDAKGEENNRARKSATKVLEKIADVLARVMSQDESIFYAARVQAPIGFWEQYGMGWYVYRVTSTALVFTNRRILHFGVDSGGKWKGILKAVAYGDIAKAEPKGWLGGVLWLTYKSGKKEKYWNLRGGGVKKLKALLAVLLPASSAESTEAQAMVSLCPECLSPLAERVYHCARCGLVFKDEKTMVKRSWLIPGGGYFYSGQTFLGVMDFLAEAWLTVLALLMGFAAYATWGKPAPKNPDAMDATGALIMAGFLLALLAVEKLFTIHHCRRFIRDFISTGQKDPMRAQMAAASLK